MAGVALEVQVNSILARHGGRTGTLWERGVLSELIRKADLVAPRYRDDLREVYRRRGGRDASGALRKSLGAIPKRRKRGQVADILEFGYLDAPFYASARERGVAPGRTPSQAAILRWMDQIGKDMDASEPERRQAARRISRAIKNRGLKAINALETFVKAGRSSVLRKEIARGAAEGALRAVMTSEGPQLQLGGTLLGARAPGFAAGKIAGKPVVGTTQRIGGRIQIRGPGGKFAGLAK